VLIMLARGVTLATFLLTTQHMCVQVFGMNFVQLDGRPSIPLLKVEQIYSTAYMYFTHYRYATLFSRSAPATTPLPSIPLAHSAPAPAPLPSIPLR
jgi:hypothetical protein